MIRKDPAQDTDRAHYYSQFWIEVAAGRPIGQGSTATDEAEEAEDTDFEALLSAPPMATPDEAPPRAEVKPKPRLVDKKEPARSLSSLADLANIADLMNQSAQMEDDTVPDIEAGVADELEPGIVTDFDFGGLPEEEEEPEALAQEEEDLGDFEEEEEEDEWGNTRRPKKPQKPPRRDRRGF
jgi:hypothetical protein